MKGRFKETFIFLIILCFSCSRVEPIEIKNKKEVVEVKKKESSLFLSQVSSGNVHFKSEKQLSIYFDKYKSEQTKSISHTSYESFKKSIVKNTKKLEKVTGLDWKINTCNMFVESRFNEVESSAPAYGIAQLEKRTVDEVLRKIASNRIENDNFKKCRKDFSGFNKNFSYEKYLSKFTCEDKKNKRCSRDAEYCSNVYKNIYRADKYQFFAKSFFEGKVPKKANWNRDVSMRSDEEIYPIYYKHNMFFSSYMFFELASKIDSYLVFKAKKILGDEASYNEIRRKVLSFFRNDEDKFRAIQLLAASYNGGVGKIAKVLKNPKLESFSSMYKEYLEETKKIKGGVENRAHMLKIARCLHRDDERAPFFKHAKEKTKDSFKIASIQRR